MKKKIKIIIIMYGLLLLLVLIRIKRKIIKQIPIIMKIIILIWKITIKIKV